MNEMIIDPPVGPYSEPEAIEAWLEELREMPENDDVQAAIDQAEGWLDAARKR